MTVEVKRPPALQTPVKVWRPLWWTYPAWVVTVLACFGAYAFYAMLDAAHGGQWGPYLSPFYSPPFFRGFPISGAFYVAWIPLGFRLSCYYYRKAYYRSFAWQPPACAVPDRPGGYEGETRFPFIFNNAHRFFLYITLFVLVFLWKDAISAFWFHGRFYVGLGGVLMIANVSLLSGYTLGCHALRNLVGGGVNCFSCTLADRCRHKTWRFVSLLNGRHPTWAWISMFSVGITDIYIRLLIHGVIPKDPHLPF